MYWNTDKNTGNKQFLIKVGEERPTAADGAEPGDMLLELSENGSNVYVYYTDGNWYEL